MTRRWLWRLLTAAVLLVVLDAALTWLDFAPDHLRLALVVALTVAVVGVVQDTFVDSGVPWSAPDQGSALVAGGDTQLSGYVRLIEGHLTAAVPDTVLRDRLAALCEERLARRRGLAPTDPAARELLGADLYRDLYGEPGDGRGAQPRRLGRERIRDHLSRIEEL